MRSQFVAVVLGALFTMVPAEARADWMVRPFFGAALNPQHGFVDLEQNSGHATVAAGAAAGWHPDAIGFEFELGSLPRFFAGPDDLVTGGNVTTIMGNVTWRLPGRKTSSRFAAYVAGGAGVVRVRLEDALGAFSSTTTLASGNAGGGVLIRVRPRLAIDVDARYFKTRYGDAGRAGFGEEFLSFTRLTGGVLLRF